MKLFSLAELLSHVLVLRMCTHLIESEHNPNFTESFSPQNFSLLSFLTNFWLKKKVFFIYKFPRNARRIHAFSCRDHPSLHLTQGHRSSSFHSTGWVSYNIVGLHFFSNDITLHIYLLCGSFCHFRRPNMRGDIHVSI